MPSAGWFSLLNCRLDKLFSPGIGKPLATRGESGAGRFAGHYYK
jgi:hypothetical protein